MALIRTVHLRRSSLRVNVLLNGNVHLALVESSLGGLNANSKMALLGSSRSYVIKEVCDIYRAGHAMQNPVTLKIMTATELSTKDSLTAKLNAVLVWVYAWKVKLYSATPISPVKSVVILKTTIAMEVSTKVKETFAIYAAQCQLTHVMV